MAKLSDQNVNVNFNYCMQAVVLFMSDCCTSKVNFIKKNYEAEKEINFFIKLDADLQFL